MRLFKRLLFLCGSALLMLTFWLVYFANTPIKMEKHSQEIALKNGSSLRSVSKQLVAQKLLNEPFSFNLLVRVLGKTNEIKAGVYSIETGITPYDLINILVQGKTTQANITFIEGWTFAQMRAAINQHTDIKHTTTNFSDLEIMKKIGAEIEMPEGQFFPDTYFFAKGMSDQDIFKRAYLTMQTKLNSAWQNRSSDLPYLTPYQALIMASIVEKETGKSSERVLIAGVFLNRLNIGMRLQTDPSVIYGLGENFDGNLRKKDLQQDTVYNTYTRGGLPPTPIAMPGLASIEAALNPAKSNALYFVGKGDGSHAFSATLSEHNRAVTRFQLKQGH